MKRIILSVVLFTFISASFGKTWTVTNSGNTFTPQTLTILQGDTVKFDLEGDHNAVEVSQTTWNANGKTALAGGFSAPFGGGLVLPAKLTTGTHYYVCTPHAAFGMKATIIVQNNTTTGFSEKPISAGVTISPNPSNGIFQVEVKNTELAKSFELGIYNIVGEKVYVKSDLQMQNPAKINIADLPKGIYFVKLNGGKESISRKIIVR